MPGSLSRWVIAGLVCAGLYAAVTHAQDAARWKERIDAGGKAYLQGQYGEAEKMLL